MVVVVHHKNIVKVLGPSPGIMKLREGSFTALVCVRRGSYKVFNLNFSALTPAQVLISMLFKSLSFAPQPSCTVDY